MAVDTRSARHGGGRGSRRRTRTPLPLAVAVLSLLLAACPPPSVSVLEPRPVSTEDAVLGADGRVLTDVTGDDDRARDVVVLADGRIAVLGWGEQDGRSAGFVARYLPSGELDESFGNGGVRAVEGRGTPAALAPHPDGSLLAVTTSGSAVDVRRLAPQGASSPGPEPTPAWERAEVPAPPGDVVTSVSVADAFVDDDGRLVVAGGFAVNREEDVGGCCAIEPDSATLLLRFDVNGSLDTSFGDSGFVLGALGTGEGTRLTGVAPAGDGGLVATGTGESDVLAWQEDGTSRPPPPGVVASLGPARADASAAGPDGELVVAGVIDGYGYEPDRLAVVRGTVDGDARVSSFEGPPTHELRVDGVHAGADASTVVGRLVTRDEDGIPSEPSWFVAVARADGRDDSFVVRDDVEASESFAPLSGHVRADGDAVAVGTLTRHLEDDRWEDVLALVRVPSPN